MRENELKNKVEYMERQIEDLMVDEKNKDKLIDWALKSILIDELKTLNETLNKIKNSSETVEHYLRRMSGL